MEINPLKILLTVNHEYPDFNLKMHGILCESKTNQFTLTEHIDYKWLKKEELDSLDWAAADIPIVNLLTK